VPTDLDAYKPERWVGKALAFPETKDLYRPLVARGGQTLSVNSAQMRRSIPTGTISGTLLDETRDCGWTVCF
jgi:hypothetical protein